MLYTYSKLHVGACFGSLWCLVITELLFFFFVFTQLSSGVGLSTNSQLKTGLLTLSLLELHHLQSWFCFPSSGSVSVQKLAWIIQSIGHTLFVEQFGFSQYVQVDLTFKLCSETWPALLVLVFSTWKFRKCAHYYCINSLQKTVYRNNLGGHWCILCPGGKVCSPVCDRLLMEQADRVLVRNVPALWKGLKWKYIQCRDKH